MARAKYNTERQDELALHLACGGSIRKFAERAGIAERTAYQWASKTAVKSRVQFFRRELDDRLIGQLTIYAVAAAGRLNRMAETSQSDAVRVAADRTLLGAKARTILMDLHRRLIELEGLTGHGSRKSSAVGSGRGD